LKVSVKGTQQDRDEQLIRRLYHLAEAVSKDTPQFVSLFADGGYFYNVATGERPSRTSRVPKKPAVLTSTALQRWLSSISLSKNRVQPQICLASKKGLVRQFASTVLLGPAGDLDDVAA
jgi:hypothetical protein